MLDGKVVGLGGIFFRDELPVIFAEFDPGLCRAATARRASGSSRRSSTNGPAGCSRSATGFASAPGLLDRLGFRPTVQEPWWVREA
jgi:hypothetical protein